MKPASFEYHRAHDVAEVVELLVELGDDAKIIAGGQSLAPMMNFRLARPSALVDVNPVSGLDYIRREGDLLRIGAMTRHRDVEISRDPEVHDGFAVLPRAARWIGHYPIRCRGTVGGSMAHSDPTAEWCLLALLHDASVVVQGPRGQRTVPVAEWFTGFLTTSGEYDEMVVETQFARPRAYGALTEYARRRGDFAISAVGVAFDKVDNRLTDVSVVLGGVAGVPVRATEAEAMLEGSPATPETWVAASRNAAASVNPPSDLNGDGDYRRQLVETLMQRAFVEALAEGARR
ncbi:MAG: xanthine dehydrogenase family protein subunit M [Nocardioides sp.]|nr:xanthine dehydrogenase family protein subunit M [Nocardioides sp.]